MAGLYVHIPFCRQACTYCNFHFSTSVRSRAEVLEAICREAALRAPEAAHWGPFQTVYIGGGTPSLLSPADLQQLFGALAAQYDLNAVSECTLEANPDDLSAEWLEGLKALTPVDRLSVGVQSFREEDLRYTHRAHSAAQALDGLKAATAAGFSNLSLDLIYGIPGLTDEAWLCNLDMADALGITHLSCYALTVEEGTALHHAIRHKKSQPVDSEQSARQFDILMRWASERGWEHYEISNLARPGHRAVHNTAYWTGAPYIGLGPSAHSFDGKDTRRWNVANNALYARTVLGAGEVPHETETLSHTDRLNEYIMTSLRTVWGLDLQAVAKEWGQKRAQTVRTGLERPLGAELAQMQESRVVLTDAGRHYADGIAAELFF